VIFWIELLVFKHFIIYLVFEKKITRKCAE